MFKTTFCFLVIFLLTAHQSVHSQSGKEAADSTIDSVQTSDDSSVYVEEANTDSLLLPVADSIYMPAEIIREVPAGQLSKYLKDRDYAYANDPEYWKKQPPPKPGLINQFLNTPVFRWLIFIGVIGVVLFGIYQLAKENNFTWFSRKGTQQKDGPAEISPDEETDYEAAIRKYQSEGNYRMAVRYLYLRLIRSVKEQGGIIFRDSSTNAEILRAFGNHAQAGDFRYLAIAYEYIFYGDFNPRPDLFDMLKNKFELFQQKISN